jgi:hypothetical protein
MNLPQDRVQWRAVLNKVVKFRAALKGEYLEQLSDH